MQVGSVRARSSHNDLRDGLSAWVIWPVSLQIGGLLMLAGVGQGVRMLCWRGWRVLDTPLVLMPHMAFAFVPADLVALSLPNPAWRQSNNR